MFSGIVEEIGVVAGADWGEGRLRITAARVLGGVAAGDSIAVNGCCLTVTMASPSEFSVDVMPETLRRTNLGELSRGVGVNLEAALAMGDRIGGHLVTGHIDGVGIVTGLRDEANARRLTCSIPAGMTPLLAPRGSVAINGISLTVVTVGDDDFTVSLIPHTLATTVAGTWSAGSRVNLEGDLLARYILRALEARDVAAAAARRS